MNLSIKFWVFMVIFQVAFGLAVFTLTRSHYLEESQRPAAPMAPGHPATPAAPDGSAASDWDQLMDLYPANPAEVDLQKVLMQADEDFSAARYPQAAEGYSQLVRSGSAAVDIYNNLGITMHYLGRSQEALNILRSGIERDPSYQRIWLTQGFVSSQIGNIELARRSLQQAVDLDPTNEVGLSAQSMLNQLPPGP